MDARRWQQIQELFEVALRYEGAERLRFLNECCGDDLDLFKEIVSLLEADQMATPFPDLPLPAMLPSEGRRLLPGERFHHYRIISRLGAGGMGVVYKAFDMRLERTVALKFLSERLVANQNAKDRFVIEAKAASKLDHPNICTIYEIGNLEDGPLFISMAFCEGRTLEDLIKAGRITPDQALSIAVQIADGLRQAHARQIIHCDIKPANVIVGQEGVAKIVDFGVAKLLETELTDSDATRIGTFCYMSPEQLRGDALDHRSDLWSLGVLLYELLTGCHPFPGDDSATIQDAVLHNDPVSVSRRLPGAAPALDRIVSRLLTRELDQRYQTAEALSTALGELRRLGAWAEPVSGLIHTSGPFGPPSAELRQVTVVFVELCEFAKLSAGLGPEDSHHLLGLYVNAVQEVVERYGGVVDRHIGVTVMAVFGAPLAHRNDCERALRTAADVHEGMVVLDEVIAHRPQVRVGIAGGRQMASSSGQGRHDAYTITGDSVDLAANLVRLAKPGETLISDRVYRTASGLVEVEVEMSAVLRDSQDQAPVWRLLAVRSGSPEKSSYFVGRRAELLQLAAILEGCRDGGQGAVVLLRGQAGIGKTTLLGKFRAIAKRNGFDCHTGLVIDFGVVEGQDAISSLVRSFLGIPPGSLEEDRRRSAHAAVTDGAIEADQLVFLYDLLNLPPSAEFRSVNDAMDNATRNQGRRQVVSALLRASSAKAPLLVIVEDVHWADPLTLEYLSTIVAGIAECRALLVITTRLEEDPLGPTWPGAIHDVPVVSITLAALRRDEAERLASKLMGTASHLARRCVERAEGNPLFLEHLLRSARETPDEGVPSTIRSLVLSRLDRLSEADKTAIRAASVVGQYFTLDLLRYLLGQANYDCQELLRQYLVRPKGKGFLFAHALIKDCIHESLLKSQRQQLHRRAAEWFAGRDLGLRAEHLDRAEDDGAPQAYLEAAEAQMLLNHYDQALRLAERGLAVASVPSDSFRLNCVKGELLRELGLVAQSLEAFEAARDMARDNGELCWAWIGKAEGLRLLDDYDQAFEVLERAQNLAVPQRMARQLAQIFYLRGSLYFPLGRVDACREQHEAALENARRAGSPEREALALSGLGDAAYARGRMHTAMGYFRDCLTLSAKHDLGRIEAANRSMIGTIRVYLNDLEGALQDSLESAQLAARVGHKRAEIGSRLTAGWVLIDQGRLDLARTEIERGLAVTRDLGAKRFRPFLNESLARILMAEGARDAACRLLEEALVEARDVKAMAFVGPWLLGSLALATEDPLRHEAALSEGEALLASGCVGHNHYRFRQAAMETALQACNWDEAARQAASLENYTRPEPVPWADYYVARARALLAQSRRGRSAETNSRLAELIVQAKDIGLQSAVPLLQSRL